VPGTVTTDRGAQFTSALWSSTCMSLGIKHVLTTAYHPQSNGMVERVHRQLKDALRARGAGPAWHSHLPWVLLGLRAAPKEDSAVSSAELVTGTPHWFFLDSSCTCQILHVSTCRRPQRGRCPMRAVYVLFNLSSNFKHWPFHHSSLSYYSLCALFIMCIIHLCALFNSVPRRLFFAAQQRIAVT
jgi:transposase InsO family protein